MYNYEASDFSADDYSVFMNLGKGIGIISKGNGENVAGKPNFPQPTHIACSTFGLARMDFSVFGTYQLRAVAPKCWTGTGSNGEWIGFPNPACSTYALMLSVTSEHFKTFSGVHTGYILWVSPSVTAGGWAHLVKFTAHYWDGKYNVPGYIASATCADCMFKWMTSIAQTKGNTLADGSYYSAVWFKREISGYALNESYDDGGTLTTLREGITDCSEYPLWHPPYSQKYQADCTDSPSGLKGTARTVQVKNYVAEGEWDIITAKY